MAFKAKPLAGAPGSALITEKRKTGPSSFVVPQGPWAAWQISFLITIAMA